MVNEEKLKKLLADNVITNKHVKSIQHGSLKYEFPSGFSIPVSNGSSILCRIVLSTICKSLDYSGALIGISISSTKPFETTKGRSKHKKKSKKVMDNDSAPP
eukprot:390399_1